MRRSARYRCRRTGLAIAAGPACVQTDRSEAESAFDGDGISLADAIEVVTGEGVTRDQGAEGSTVEMGDTYGYDGNAVLSADQVTVPGRMKQSFRKLRPVESSSVDVPKSIQSFCPGPQLKGSFCVYPVSACGGSGAPAGGNLLVVGDTVESIDGQRMTVDTDVQSFAVDARRVPGEPIVTTIDVGERAVGTGAVEDAHCFDRRAIAAASVVIPLHSAVEEAAGKAVGGADALWVTGQDWHDRRRRCAVGCADGKLAQLGELSGAGADWASAEAE
jgi:hypothetical protein